jgi:hypothetical protein
VALQAVGAAAGNMIAIHNVVAASATVGILGQEGNLLRKTILPTLYYVVAAGLLGLAAVYLLGLDDPLVFRGLDTPADRNTAKHSSSLAQTAYATVVLLAPNCTTKALTS